LAAGKNGHAPLGGRAEGLAGGTSGEDVEADVVDAVVGLASDVEEALAGLLADSGEGKGGDAVTAAVPGPATQGDVLAPLGELTEHLTPVAVGLEALSSHAIVSSVAVGRDLITLLG
jgi:hypothetical protein